MKCLSFTRAVSLPVLGVIENMSGYVCPCCGEISNVFSTGGGKSMADREGLRFLGALPIDTELVTLLDGVGNLDENGDAIEGEDEGKVTRGGFSLSERYQRTPTSKLFKVISDQILEILASQTPEETVD
jgi:hypothetical protein